AASNPDVCPMRQRPSNAPSARCRPLCAALIPRIRDRRRYTMLPKALLTLSAGAMLAAVAIAPNSALAFLPPPPIGGLGGLPHLGPPPMAHLGGLPHLGGVGPRLGGPGPRFGGPAGRASGL